VKDVEEIVSKGRITSNDGVLIRVPKDCASPII
jgi:hypothetical protein